MYPVIDLDQADYVVRHQSLHPLDLINPVQVDLINPVQVAQINPVQLDQIVPGSLPIHRLPVFLICLKVMNLLIPVAQVLTNHSPKRKLTWVTEGRLPVKVKVSWEKVWIFRS